MAGFTIESMDFSALDDLKARLPGTANRAEHTLAMQIAKDTQRYVPMLTGSLVNRTRVKENTIIYPGPYARYLYYGKVMVNAATGKGPAHYVDKHGNEVIRFPKGARLRATDENLVFTTSAHPDATAHWLEASKAQNMETWLRVAQKGVARELANRK